MIKASDATTMKTLLMTEKRHIHTVRGRACCLDLSASMEDMVPD